MSTAVPIKNYEQYRIDRYGNVTNRKGQTLKQELSNNGYMRVALYKNQKHKKFSVHRLVAEAFCTNENNLPQVNHIDRNKLNNNADNLEWCDCIYNLNHSGVIDKASVAKFTRVKCETTGETFDSIKEACDKYDIHHANIVACCNGRRHTTGGLKWSYQT